MQRQFRERNDGIIFQVCLERSVTGLYTIEEDFVQFLHCPKVTGEGLFQVLMDYTTAKGIPMQNGRAQGYDGGGNMAGKNNGLQARVKAAYPKMPYQWCAGHCLNLCIGKACAEKLVVPIVENVKNISIAYEYSAKRQEYFRQAVQENAENSDLGRKKKVAMLSETRWSARKDAFQSVKDGIHPLVSSLEKLAGEGDEKAPGLLACTLEFCFLVGLVIIARALVLTSILSSKLQYETLDLNDACEYGKATSTKLKSWVRDEAQEEKEEVAQGCEEKTKSQA